MNQEPGFYLAAPVSSPLLCISHQLNDHEHYVSSAGGRMQVLSAGDRGPGVSLDVGIEDGRDKSAEEHSIERGDVKADGEARHPKRPFSIRRPI